MAKLAGIPEQVQEALSRNAAFSGEYLKDMAYGVPKGYEVKGDLVCPVEKTEQSFQQTGKEKKGSLDKTASKKNVMYHGSGIEGLSELAPSASRVIDGNSAVFATPDRDVALSFLAPWRDDDFEHGSVDGQYYMREKYPDAFEKKFKNKSGTIYHLPADGFEHDPRLTKFERINKNKVKPLKAEKIENILEALQNSKFMLLKHKELAPWEKTVLLKKESLDKTASPFSRRLMGILKNKSQEEINSIIQQITDNAKLVQNKPSEKFLDKLLKYVNREHKDHGWNFSMSDAADRYHPEKGVYRTYLENPGRSNLPKGRRQSAQEKNMSSLFSEIFGGGADASDEYKLVANHRPTLKADLFDKALNSSSNPIRFSERDLDSMARRKVFPHYSLLQDPAARQRVAENTAKDKIKMLLRKGGGKNSRGLLAQYDIEKQPFQNLLFTPHLATKNNIEREDIMRQYDFLKNTLDEVMPGRSERFLQSKLFPAQNKEWARNPLYETVIDASNIVPQRGRQPTRVRASQYYIPANAGDPGAIAAKDLPNANAGFMYKGGTPQALQAPKNLKNYTGLVDDRIFFSGAPEISAGYIKDPAYTGYVRPAGFSDIRQRIAAPIREYKKTITAPIRDYNVNNHVTYAKPQKTAMLEKISGRCWEGYEPVPGKEPYSEDSCRPKKKLKNKL